MGSEDGETPSRHIRLLMSIIMFTMATVATTGNFTIVYLYCTRATLKKNANLLIANIAVAGRNLTSWNIRCYTNYRPLVSDMCVGMLSMSAVALSMSFNYWVLGRHICVISAFLDNVMLVTSMYLIMMISIER